MYYYDKSSCGSLKLVDSISKVRQLGWGRGMGCQMCQKYCEMAYLYISPWYKIKLNIYISSDVFIYIWATFIYMGHIYIYCSDLYMCAGYIYMDHILYILVGYIYILVGYTSPLVGYTCTRRIYIHTKIYYYSRPLNPRAPYETFKWAWS